VPASSSPSNRHCFPALSSTPFHHFPFISHSRPLPLHSLTQGSRLPSLPPHKPLLPSHKFFLRFLLPFSLLPLNRFHRLPFSSAKKPRAASPSLPKNRDRSPLPSVSSLSSRFQHLLFPSPASSSPSSAAEQPPSGSNQPSSSPSSAAEQPPSGSYQPSSSSLTDPICHPKQRRRRRSPNPQTGLQRQTPPALQRRLFPITAAPPPHPRRWVLHSGSATEKRRRRPIYRGGRETGQI